MKAKQFAVAHNISQDFSNRRPRKVKRMAGEIGQDEQIQNREVAFKTNVYIFSLDIILVQLQDRFTDINISVTV